MKINVLKKITYLAPELKNIIYSYLTAPVRAILTKNNYLCSYETDYLKNLISSKNWNSFIRNIVRNDNIMVFSKLLSQNNKTWNKPCKYHFNNTTYYSYILFIHTYAIKNNSQKIRKLLLNNNYHNKSIKRSKKATVRTTQWSI